MKFPNLSLLDFFSIFFCTFCAGAPAMALPPWNRPHGHEFPAGVKNYGGGHEQLGEFPRRPKIYAGETVDRFLFFLRHGLVTVGPAKVVILSQRIDRFNL